MAYTIWKIITSSLRLSFGEGAQCALHHLERGSWDHFVGSSRAEPSEGGVESSMETGPLTGGWGADDCTSRSDTGT